MVDNNHAFHIYYGAAVLNYLLRRFFLVVLTISKSNLFDISDGLSVLNEIQFRDYEFD